MSSCYSALNGQSSASLETPRASYSSSEQKLGSKLMPVHRIILSPEGENQTQLQQKPGNGRLM